MDRPDRSLPADYFERLYEHGADPWRFATSAYERDKYAATIAALPRASYERALEVGCSIGVFTRLLAGRARHLLAIDIAEGALVQARERCRDLPEVEFARMALPGEAPSGQFDLIVLSEVLYYWSPADLAAVAAFVGGALAEGGNVVLVHWTGGTDYPLDGDVAVELFLEHTRAVLGIVQQARTEHYRLDVLQRRRSDAGRER